MTKGKNCLKKNKTIHEMAEYKPREDFRKYKDKNKETGLNILKQKRKKVQRGWHFYWRQRVYRIIEVYQQR